MLSCNVGVEGGGNMHSTSILFFLRNASPTWCPVAHTGNCSLKCRGTWGSHRQGSPCSHGSLEHWSLDTPPRRLRRWWAARDLSSWASHKATIESRPSSEPGFLWGWPYLQKWLGKTWRWEPYSPCWCPNKRREREAGDPQTPPLIYYRNWI